MDLRKDPRGFKSDEDKRLGRVKQEAFRAECDIRALEPRVDIPRVHTIPSEREMEARLDRLWSSAQPSKGYAPRQCTPNRGERVNGKSGSAY